MDLRDPARVVTSPSISAVLRVLVEAPHAQLSMREIAAIAGISHSAAQTVLHRLIEHGVVLTTTAGRATLCRYNHEHLAAEALAALVTLRAKLVERLAAEISAWPEPAVHASLYGSGARVDGGSRSDLDILLVRPTQLAAGEEAWDRQLSDTSARMRLRSGNPVSYVEMTRPELVAADLAGERIVARWRADAVHLAGEPLDRLLRASA